MLLFASIITQTYSVHATSLEKEILIDTKELKLSYDVIELDNKLEWRIYAEKNTENPTKLKFEINATNMEKFSSDTILEQKDNNNQNIYVEEEYSHKNTSELVFTTGKEENSIDLSIQMDEEVVFDDGTTQINENMLDVSLSGTYEMKFENQIDSIIPEESSDKSENLIVEEADTNTEELEENLVIGPQMRSSLMAGVESASPLAATAAYTDPFSYTTLSDSSVDGVKGIYPKINTNSYLNPTGTSEFIRNFDYARSYTATPKTINILNGTQNFINGYHNYQMDSSLVESNVMTKKTVKPNSADPTDPTKFDIQLDIIGGTTEVKKQVDVVFVIDKSTSMVTNTINGETRYKILQNAMTTFTDGLLSQNNLDIQMGMVSFGSNGTTSINSNIAKYGSSNKKKYFTNTKTDFLTNTVFTSSPPRSGSGTPTFLGVDMGVQVLTDSVMGARPNAEKFLIVLTDGAATFAKGIKYNTNSVLTNKKQNINDDSFEVKNEKDNDYFIGNGSSSQGIIYQIAENNADYIKSKYLSNLSTARKYSIGFTRVEDQTEYMKTVLYAAGPDKPVNPKNPYLATDSEDLKKVLAQIKNNITSVNNNFRAGSVIDPMSEYVIYDKNSVKTSALTLKGNTSLDVTEINSTSPDYAKNVVVSKDDNQITLENMNLGGSETERYGYRLNYTVQLKSDYQNGNFYPANGPTYAYEPNYNRTLGFAVPSVKVQPSKAEITVEKKWNDQDNKFKKRQDVIFQLQKSVKGSSSWENISDKKLTIAANATGSALKGSFGEVVFKVGNTEYEYRVIENNVNGYDKPEYSLDSVTLNSLKHVVITNKLQTMNIQMKKVAGDGTTALAGAGFTVFKEDDMSIMIPEKTSGADGLLNFSDLPIGTYVLRETKVPNGFKRMSDITFEIKQAFEINQDVNTRKLSATGLPEQNILKNNLNEFSLMVTKKDQYEKAVTGVTFKLKEIKTGKETILKSENNEFKFSSLVSGDYALEEIVTPNSYAILEQPIKIAISALGIVTVDGIKKENVLTQDGNIINLTVINKAKGVLPQTGGSGYEQYKLASLGLFIPMLGLSGYYLYKNGKGAKTYAKKKKRT